MMKRRVAILVVAVLALSGTLRAADIIDGVVAIVNSNVITYSQVMELVQPVDRELRRSFSGQELEDQRRKAQEDALNTLIERALIVQEFDAKGYKIPESYVEGQINNRIATEFGGNRAAFIKTLEAENLTLSQFRDQERERIIIEVMRDQRSRKAMVVSPYKIEKYYQDHIDEFKVGDQVKLRMIYIKRSEPVAAVTSGQDTASVTNQPASTNSEAAVGGANSEATAASSAGTVAEATTVTNTPEVLSTNSEAPTAVSTTVVSGATSIVTNTAEAATTNAASTVAGTETNTAASAPSTNSVAAIADGGTNMAASVTTDATTSTPADDLQRKLAEEILGKLDAGDSFESMARVYSEGKEAQEGGDWGWVGRDILRKELNQIAFSLKPGQHSRVIATVEGYYILEVDDVKPAHTTPLAEVRDDIEKTLLQQQRAQMQEQWVKDLRARAYIRLF
jgi:parvulin-like peptidyl-prolyl isomerase